jgi:hypothetical protein
MENEFGYYLEYYEPVLLLGVTGCNIKKLDFVPAQIIQKYTFLVDIKINSNYLSTEK